MAKQTSHYRRKTQEVQDFVTGLRENSTKGNAFDSAAAGDFVTQSLEQSGGAKVPETLAAVFAESNDKQQQTISRCILDSANNYKEMHGVDAPADVLEHALHMAYSTTKDALDSTSENHDALSLQPNRAVVAIMAAMSEAIPFAHYLPADIKSNEARLAIMSHQAGDKFGGYDKGALMDGVSSGDRYISTSREHMCTIVGGAGTETGAITGKITGVQLTSETCDPAGTVVPLLRGRSLIYVNGQVVGREVSATGTGPSAVSGQVVLAGVTHNISGTIDPANGDIALTAAPAIPAANEVLVEAFIDYEADSEITPTVITEVEVFKLYANPWRVLAKQSIDSRTQMSSELGLDPYSEGVIAIQAQFGNERHYDVLRKARRLAKGNQETFHFNWTNRGDHRSRSDVWRDLSSVLGALSQKMANDTMNHGITHLYVGNYIGAQMHGLPSDIWVPSGISERPGIFRLGRLFGRYDVYYSPKGVVEALDGSSGEILCIGQATDVTRNPFVLGDAVAPMVVPLSTTGDLKSGAAFYARNFTAVNPHKPSSLACARVNVTGLI